MEASGYIKTVGIRETKAGFTASIYGLTTKAYLATLFSSTNLDGLLRRVDDDTAQTILAALLETF